MEHERISITAHMTATARVFTDIPYSAEIADKLRRLQAENLPLVLEAHYKTINRALAAEGSRQVLELASGFLPRGMEMTRDPSVFYLETDLPETIELKRKLCAELVGERHNLQFAPLSATADLMEVAGRFQDKPLAVVTEGLLMYLTHEEKAQVCRGVLRLLERFGGVWLTCDFTATMGVRHRLPHDPVIARRMERLQQFTGRSLVDNAFEDLDEARRFVQDQGFAVEEHSQLEAELSCVEIMGYQPEFVRTLLEGRPVFGLRKGS